MLPNFGYPLFATLVITVGVFIYRNYFSAEAYHQDRTYRCEICKNSIQASHATYSCVNGDKFHTSCWNSLTKMGALSCPLCEGRMKFN